MKHVLRCCEAVYYNCVIAAAAAAALDNSRSASVMVCYVCL